MTISESKLMCIRFLLGTRTSLAKEKHCSISVDVGLIVNRTWVKAFNSCGSSPELKNVFISSLNGISFLCFFFGVDRSKLIEASTASSSFVIVCSSPSNGDEN